MIWHASVSVFFREAMGAKDHGLLLTVPQFLQIESSLGKPIAAREATILFDQRRNLCQRRLNQRRLVLGRRAEAAVTQGFASRHEEVLRNLRRLICSILP